MMFREVNINGALTYDSIHNVARFKLEMQLLSKKLAALRPLIVTSQRFL